MPKYFGQDKLVDKMIWSFSRYKTFVQCPRQWERTYILNDESNLNNYYAQWGSICHQVLQEYYNSMISKKDMVKRFMDLYQGTDMMPCPFNGEEKQIDAACEYFDNFEDIVVDPYKVVAVEKELHCTIGGWYWFKFIPDLLVINEQTNGFIIIDHKSSDLKLGTKNKSINKKISEYEEQLYMYSIGIEQLYGRPVENLYINSIKGKRWLDLGFCKEKQLSAKDSFMSTISEIMNEELFECKPDNFMCKNLCRYRLNDCPHGYFSEDGLFY